MIAVKDMQMPKSCWDCPIIDKENGQCQKTKKYIYGNDIPSDCPLVEIVTCKDCKHYKRIELNSCDEVITFCEKHSDKNCRYTSPNFYCADGERRE